MSDVCAWPGCEVPWPLVSLDDGPFHCLTHVTDDFLPAVFTARVSHCHQCSKPCVTWLDVGDEGVLCLHAHCRRPWAWVRVRGERQGAYGRREAARTGPPA